MTNITPQNHPSDKSDLHMDHFFMRYVPRFARPYAVLMRLDRPIGTWLLLLPAWFSLTLAYPQHPDLGHALFLAALFAIGAVIMRGAGCVVNDLWDRDLDASVARTRTRPLVTGAVTPRAAMMLVAGLCAGGLGILTQMNIAAIITAFCSAPFIVLYPLMKRITWWPQVFLGFTFNFGALIAWAAMTGTISLPAVLLYIAGIFWTLGYDTIYAHMDRDDDAKIGIKSTARLFGEHTVPAIAGFYGACTLFLFLALYFGAASLMVLPAIIAIAIGFKKQVGQINIDDPAQCLKIFKSNRDQGFVILIALIVCAYSVM